MAKYSIKDIEKLSGIKAHTIRIWEQRYNLLNPKRTKTNIRYYDDDDIKRILNVSILVKYGKKISHVSSYTDQELKEQVKNIASKFDQNTQLNELVVYMMEFDEYHFHNFFSEGVNELGIEKYYTDIIYPFLEKIGVLWQVGSISPAQEHFMSNLIRQKLISAIDDLNGVHNDKLPTYLLYLHEKELHEIGLLMYSFLLKKNGFKVTYLGQSVPFSDLESVVESANPSRIITSFINGITKKELEGYLEKLSKVGNNLDIFITGFQVKDKQPKLPKNITFVRDIQGFKDACL